MRGWGLGTRLPMQHSNPQILTTEYDPQEDQSLFGSRYCMLKTMASKAKPLCRIVGHFSQPTEHTHSRSYAFTRAFITSSPHPKEGPLPPPPLPKQASPFYTQNYLSLGPNDQATEFVQIFSHSTLLDTPHLPYLNLLRAVYSRSLRGGGSWL